MPSTEGSNPSDILTEAASNAVAVAERVERSLQQALGISEPIAVTLASRTIEAVVSTVSEELGAIEVSVNASSSARFLSGEVGGARVAISSVSALGVRASALTLDVASLTLDRGSLLDTPPRPPNLRTALPVAFTIRFTQDDINRSPVLFAALQELLRELLRTGASAAIGEALPRDSEALVVNLQQVLVIEDGRVVLVADATSQQPDSTLTLNGLKVRTSPRISRTGRSLELGSPELVSSFEGFGAKVELGLPFLRGAAIPLPDFLRLKRLQVESGLIRAEGEVVIQPLDYTDLSRTVDEFRSGFQAAEPQSVILDPEVRVEPPSPPPSAGALGGA